MTRSAARASRIWPIIVLGIAIEEIGIDAPAGERTSGEWRDEALRAPPS